MTIEIKEPTIYGIIFAIITMFVLYYFLKLEGMIKYSPIIIIISIILILGILVSFSFLYKKISWLIEPEDSKDILNLKMNQSLAFVLSLFGFGLTFVIAGILPSFSFDLIKGVSLLIGFLLIFIGQIIFATEYLPRFEKLMIIYKNEETFNRKNRTK